MDSTTKQAEGRRYLIGSAAAAPAVAATSVTRRAKSSVQTPRWDRTADAFLFEPGYAVLSAAITAGDAGAKVFLLERIPQKYEGGNSRVSGNIWRAPTNVPEGLSTYKRSVRA